MADASTSVISYAFFVAISPIPLIAVVALLAGPNGRTNGVAFLFGWLAGLVVAGSVLVLLIGEPSDAQTDDSSNPFGWALLAFGAAMVWLGIKHLRERPGRGATPEPPGWLSAVDQFDALRSVALALTLAIANPKNLILLGGAAASAAESGTTLEARLEAMLVFAMIALIGPAIPVATSVFAGERAEPVLGRLRAWLTRNNSVIVAIICLVIAGKLIADGIAALT
ncbi:MAG: GAP family protein [Thermoleophilaceae bacterium]|nr:GAP family protein [Thermoleophilaceae bacterium]